MHPRYAALPALCAIACGAHAAELPAVRGQPVIVTATRFEDRSVDKPVNVTVINEEAIRNSPARTVPDLLAAEAGIVVHDFFGNNAANTTIDLRGFGSSAQN